MKIQQPPIVKRVLSATLKTVGILVSLYLFIVSLTFLSTSFRILGGRNLSSFFSNSELLSNPVVGVMIGILVTVLVQSSSTSTSIIVALVSAGVEVKHAVPMIFGSNIGTSVTNTIVSMTQVGDKEAFRRAFAAATVHDMFNWLTVIVMVVLEVSTGMMEYMTEKLVDHMPLGANFTNPDLLKPLTGPLTDIVVQLDKEVLMGWSFNKPEYVNVTTILKSDCNEDGSPCGFLLAYLGEEGLGLEDVWLGLILLAVSLTLLCGCLVTLMKILNSLMGSQMAGLIQKTINADIPNCPWLTGYLGMLVGAVITILVRSSSVFTSTLTPLCGSGLVSLETAYPLTLGSNIGTTTTSILASFAAEGKYLKPSIQISMVHLFFNVIGILIFYPIPWMRWPIFLAQKLGDLTAEYRWFAAMYLVLSFFVLPALIFALSLAGLVPLYCVIGSVTLFLSVIGIINMVQRYKPEWLPSFLKNWEILPLWMRSLKPLDDFFARVPCCRKCTTANIDSNDEQESDVEMAVRADYSMISQQEEPSQQHVHKTPTGLSSSISKTPLIRDQSFADSVIYEQSIEDEKRYYPV
jgi:sodium-dependent phosphate cotransporter